MQSGEPFGTVSPDDNQPEKTTVCGKHRFSDEAKAQAEELMTHYPDRKSATLPILWMAQREYGGYLTPQALQEAADILGSPRMEVEAVATFYTMYNFRPKGRHHLEVCTCLTCGCINAYKVLERLEEKLGIAPGETTKDGEFTLSEVECLDWCEAATVVQVGNKYFGHVTPENVDDLLEELKKSDDHTPAGLADDIIRVMLPERPQKDNQAVGDTQGR